MSEDSPGALPTFRQPLIAGGLSLIVHMIVLIAGVLLLRAAPRMNLEESPRPVSIVLASATSNWAAEYFDETSADSSEATSSTAASASTAQGAAGDGLPTAIRPPRSSSEIALPGELAPVIDGVGLPTASTSGAASGRAILEDATGRDAILAEEAKRPRAKGPEGPQGEVSIFGSGTMRGHSFVFLIDRSQSMGSSGLGAIAAAETELLAALEKLESNHRFQIVAYNQAPTYFQGRKWIAVSDDSRRAGRQFLADLAAFGATDHERAIMSALQLKPDVLYLLTDGDPVLSASQRKRIHDETGGRTTISCIQFGRIRPDEEATRTALESLARENGGSYVFVDMTKR
jgi:hypothetical protein